jgi:hypothetical protein
MYDVISIIVPGVLVYLVGMDDQPKNQGWRWRGVHVEAFSGSERHGIILHVPNHMPDNLTNGLWVNYFRSCTTIMSGFAFLDKRRL